MRAADAQLAWAQLPFGDTETVFGSGRTLVLAPHPDDESLGCGGMIAELCRRGRPPGVVVLTDGTGSHAGSAATRRRALRRLREQEATEALCCLGLAPPCAPVFLRLRDTAAPHRGSLFEAAVARLCALAADCDTICAPWCHDPHCDHLAAHLMAASVVAQTGCRHVSYPVWGWTLSADTQLPDQPTGGWRLDISAVLIEKQYAIAAHRSQHGGVIDDDPNGFVLPAALLAVFARPYEVFLNP
jgi:LmbE family N-acetylglucosaminyl deacetylase